MLTVGKMQVSVRYAVYIGRVLGLSLNIHIALRRIFDIVLSIQSESASSPRLAGWDCLACVLHKLTIRPLETFWRLRYSKYIYGTFIPRGCFYRDPGLRAIEYSILVLMSQKMTIH